MGEEKYEVLSRLINSILTTFSWNEIVLLQKTTMQFCKMGSSWGRVSRRCIGLLVQFFLHLAIRRLLSHKQLCSYYDADVICIHVLFNLPVILPKKYFFMFQIFCPQTDPLVISINHYK